MKPFLSYIINRMFCSHSWRVLDECTVDTDIGESYMVLVLTCTKCGKIKKMAL